MFSADDLTQNEREVLEVLQLAAQIRGKKIGVSSIDYLIGILEGKYPQFTQVELEEVRLLRQQQSNGSN